MERTWIKLYLKILDDPRMGRLPVATWKRAMEFFMVAGEYELGNEGRLPPLDDMAWRLRASVEELNEALQVLSNAGIVHQGKDGAWVVSDFAKQQEPLGVAERVRDHRRRKRNVTKSYIAEVEACNDDVEAAAAEDVTSDSYSSSASSSDSQGEVVQEEGVVSATLGTGVSTALDTGQTPLPSKKTRPRHKGSSSAAAKTEFDLNAGTRQAERLLLRVASLAALPPGDVPRIEQVVALAARYGPEAAERELAAQHERWLKTVSEKTGKPYSPLNFGWVDWADAVLGGNAPPGQAQTVQETPAFDGEAYDKLEREAVPPPPEIARELERIRADLTKKAGLA